ncbi:hypothetical protein GCM10008014_58810 [Paenibacillus silvae]|uniref:Bacterial spore germination immunoglobulin-like domain-containing protein n=1 Tax=Paenibacillus silvae TaxID=1325358 RepID=A0ABQ1ZQI4_9BACL|nr:hypothetical protein [Paenibacillus silvae]GGH72441.1 hypothetical protein GCM10008014_58810 [Paenibacillus silvae]
MKKKWFFLFFILLLTLFACSSAKKAELTLSSPIEGAKLETTTLRIAGSISDQNVSYFFYQIEDGHSFIGSGKITINDGEFDEMVEFNTPSNGGGMVNFYLDEDGDGNFDEEKDTQKVLLSIPVTYDESIVKR